MSDEQIEALISACGLMGKQVARAIHHAWSEGYQAAHVDYSQEDREPFETQNPHELP